MKNFSIFFLITFSIYAQDKKELNPSEFRKIKTEFTKEYIENYSDEYGGNPWSIPFSGCSWYCGGRIDKIDSSTECKNINNEKQTSINIHDFNYGTCWINSDEDNKKIIEYIFNNESERFTEIVIVNGNVKSDSLWNEYSRAKKIKMYINDVEYATLKIEDIKDEQIFNFKPIGAKTNSNSKSKKEKQWKVKFEIIEFYAGKKKNIAISEIYFDGDGHEND